MIKRWLSQANPCLFSLYCILAAFSTYFCMYAFRKPYGAATYEGLEFLGTGMTLKGAFVISQIIGYTIAKYWGCKFCSEIKRGSQAKALVLMIVIAEIALLCFAMFPNNFKVLAIFINGIPLGMVWGLVSRYLEGRKTSELLFAGLSCSYIFGSSSVKTAGGWVMELGIPEFWMPATVGAIFLLPFLVSVVLLDKLPPPSEQEVMSRSERTVMGSQERRAFLKQFFLGMAFLLIVFFFLTAYRDFRDSYMPEVFRDMGYETEPTLFSKADYPIGVGVMIVLAFLNLAKNHRRGLLAVFGVMIFGMLIMIGATLLKDLEKISGLTWMILIGFGGYLAYVPFGAVLFEKIIASTRVAGTAVFAIYIADAIGYTGVVGIQLYKDFGQPNLNYYDFLRHFTYLITKNHFRRLV